MTIRDISAYLKDIYGVDLSIKKVPQTHEFAGPFTEATTRFELVIRVLQTHALPLGYVALTSLCIVPINEI